jgi:tryptophan synthase alpha chain
MSQITSIFKPGYKALIAYITAGYPDIAATPKIAAILADSGCDIIELGIPFSRH